MKRMKDHRVRFISSVLFLFSVLSLIGGDMAWSHPVRLAWKEEGRQFTFDQNGSSISFSVSSTLHPVRGEAKKFGGEIAFLSLKDPSTGKLTLDIEASSLDTNHGPRNKKMWESCLEVGRFPMIRFQSLELLNGPKSYSPGEMGRGEVLGLLDLHGVQKKVVILVDYQYTDEVVHGRGKVIIKRSDFNIPEPKLLFLGVGNEIEIVFNIQAIAASPLSRSGNQSQDLQPMSRR
jgi:polyisoprenoid-binding protein YceI